MSRNERYRKLINSTEWRRLRHDMLVKHPLCQMCQTEGRERFATEVHHVKPIESIDDMEEQTALAYDTGNLLCVCHECHVLAHRRLMSHRGQKQWAKEEARAAIENLFGTNGGGDFLRREGVI